MGGGGVWCGRREGRGKEGWGGGGEGAVSIEKTGDPTGRFPILFFPFRRQNRRILTR